MKTVKLMLILDSETNVLTKSVKKSLKTKTQFLTESTGYLIGSPWLLQSKIEFFVFMVVLEHLSKLWQTLKTLKDLLKSCTKSRMKSHK